MISVISKLFGSFFLGIEDLVRIGEGMASFFTKSGFTLEGRRAAFSKLGLALFSVPFASMLYGMVGNAWRMTSGRLVTQAS